jgi:hypothetical protein
MLGSYLPILIHKKKGNGSEVVPPMGQRLTRRRVIGRAGYNRMAVAEEQSWTKTPP